MKEIESTVVESLLNEKTDTKTTQSSNKSLKSANDLSKHLPSGTVLIFNVFSPAVTTQGHCHPAGRILAGVLVVVCGILCCISGFTDSFKDSKGHIRFGIATVGGFFALDGGEQIPAKDAVKYKLKAVDFLHGFMALLVFSSLAVSNINVVDCFYPTQTTKIHWVLMFFPLGISALSSVLFVIFPTTRRGVGYSVSDD